MKLSELYDFYDRAYALEHTQRYSMIPVNKRESVASHSYFVALGVRLLHEVYKFNLERALCMALSHDIGEIGVSDVNHVVKMKYPRLRAAIKDAEREETKSFPPCIQDDINAYALESVEAKIVHLADTIQVSQYASSEENLGNVGYMSQVKSNSRSRANKIMEELTKYERK